MLPQRTQVQPPVDLGSAPLNLGSFWLRRLRTRPRACGVVRCRQLGCA